MRQIKMFAALIVLVPAWLSLQGCAAVQVAKDRVEDRAVETATWYCEQSRFGRTVLRTEANEALEGTAALVIACASDGTGEYDQVRTFFVDPLGDPLDALILRLVSEGQITLPDGRKLRITVDE